MSADWQAIRADYENGLSLRQLAAKYSMSKSVIGDRKFKEQWEQSRTDIGHRVSTQRAPNRDINAGQKAAVALRLRAQKLTYAEIALRCDYGSPSAARKAIMREMNRVIVVSAEELQTAINEEVYMLDMLHASMFDKAIDQKNDYQTFVADRIIAISELRSKLKKFIGRPEDLVTGQNYTKHIIIHPKGEVDAASS